MTSHKLKICIPLSCVRLENEKDKKDMAIKAGIATDKAPPPLPFFSQAIKCNGMIYCSGSIGVDPSSKQMVQGSVGERTVRTYPSAQVHSPLRSFSQELGFRGRQWRKTSFKIISLNYFHSLMICSTTGSSTSKSLRGPRSWGQ